ncbi:MAG: hypothetical protein ABFS19_11415 [Thermodesulfobacteriota bacterium]
MNSSTENNSVNQKVRRPLQTTTLLAAGLTLFFTALRIKQLWTVSPPALQAILPLIPPLLLCLLTLLLHYRITKKLSPRVITEFCLLMAFYLFLVLAGLIDYYSHLLYQLPSGIHIAESALLAVNLVLPIFFFRVARAFLLQVTFQVSRD